MIPKANVTICGLDPIHRNSASHKIITQLFKTTNFSPSVSPSKVLSFPFCLLSPLPSFTIFPHQQQTSSIWVKTCWNKRVTGHKPVTHADQPHALSTAELILPTYAPAAMLKFMQPIVLLPATNVLESVNHVSEPRLPSSARQMLLPYARLVIHRFIPQTHLLDATSVFQSCQSLVPWSLTVQVRRQRQRT